MSWPLDSKHYELPEGHWWHCQYPERPAETFVSHYKRTCRACLLALLADSRNNRRKRTYISGAQTYAFYGNEALLSEWWMISTKEEMDAFLERNQRTNEPTNQRQTNE